MMVARPQPTSVCTEEPIAVCLRAACATRVQPGACYYLRHLGCYLRCLCFYLTWHDCIGWDPLGLGKKDLETLKLKEVYAPLRFALVVVWWQRLALST